MRQLVVPEGDSCGLMSAVAIANQRGSGGVMQSADVWFPICIACCRRRDKPGTIGTERENYAAAVSFVCTCGGLGDTVTLCCCSAFTLDSSLAMSFST